jgi:two-component system phosphate regulon sensor histidine kinase PhoR
VFRRLFLAYLLLLVVALAVLGILTSRSIREGALGEIALRLEAEARVLEALAASDRPPDSLQGALRELGRRSETRYTLVAPDGRVLADSHAEPRAMENHNARPEVAGARAQGRGQDVRRSETVGYEMMYFARSLDRPADHVARTALPIIRVNDEIAALYRGILIAFMAIGAAGAAVTFVVTRRITRPLRQIRSVAERIAAGDFSRRAPSATADEIGSVAAAINRMAEELRARLDRLEAEGSKLDAVLGSLQDAVVALDGEGRVLHHNAAAGPLLGVTAGAVGLRLWEVVRVPGLEERVRGVLKDGSAAGLPAEFGRRALEFRISPTRGGRGTVVVARDATEERRYDRLRKEFVANVSHELRTPVTLIKGYVETLKDGALTDEARALEFLGTIERNVERLAALVDDLLSLSRLESGGQVLAVRPFEPRPMLEGMIEKFRPLAERRRQSLALEVAPGMEVLEADPDLLERAVGNLVENAIKYTPEEGSVAVRAGLEEGEAVFTVSDTGVGIPEKDLARIFERFYRVDKSRSRDLGGTGLGLSIVKHIAQLHGGSVSVRSEVGRGSVFTLRIPRAARPS